MCKELTDAVARWRPNICKGNAKLGPDIWTWSLPAEATCPGATPACRDACYASQGTFLFRAVQELYDRNEQFSRTPFFVSWLLSRLATNNVRTLRIHASGDFYDAEYVSKWDHIVRSAPGVQFFCYTRSWRLREQRRPLRKLASRSNMSMWWSADHQTGKPTLPGPAVYMAINDDDALATPDWAGLVFRVERETVMRRSEGGVPVCPHETGLRRSTQISCSTCRICVQPKKALQHGNVSRRQVGNVVDD